MIYLDEQGIGEIRKVDSTRLKKDGRFALKDRIEIPTFYNLHLGNQHMITLLLHPGETAEIMTEKDGFADNYELSGSPESRYLQDLNRRMARTRKSLDSLAAVVADPDFNETGLPGIQAARQEIIQAQRRSTIEFILTHLNSIVSIYALYQKMDDENYVLNTNRDIQLYKITGMTLDTLYPESEYVQSLMQDAANLEQALKSRQWQEVLEAVPTSFPDIRLPDTGGDTLALSSLNGKVILLSFWASWNEESVVLNQDFKRLYNKYHDRGLEIYQVSFDNEKDRWVNAIKYDELPWINVSELSYPESTVAALYNVTELPTFFLLDREGGITGKNYERIALDRKISELIHQNQKP